MNLLHGALGWSGVCDCGISWSRLLSLFVKILLSVQSHIKHGVLNLLNLSSWCLVMVERLFLAVPRGCLQFVIVVYSDHTHLLFLVPTCKTSSLFVPLAVQIDVDCSAVPL